MQINLVRLEVIKEKTVEYENLQITKPRDLAEIGFMLLSKSDREIFLLICLDTKNNIIAVQEVSIGSLSTSIVHPREVYKLAILNNSASVAFLHNHPSGSTEPSKDDINITQKLIDSGNLLGIKALDHVIIGDGEFFSLSEHHACNFS